MKKSPPETIYIPNPVDFKLIKATSSQEKISKAFHVDRYATDLAQEYAGEYSLELEIFNREVTPLPHEEFLRLLGKFEYYIDVKRTPPPGTQALKALSLTGLEALASGAKVINWRKELIMGLPPRHELKSITRDLWDVYRKCYTHSSARDLEYETSSSELELLKMPLSSARWDTRCTS